MTSATRNVATPVELAPEDLRAVAILADLDEAVRKDIARYGAGLRYPAGRTIIKHGEATRDVYLIVSGEARVNLYTAGGRHITFEILDAGQMFGELAGIDDRPRSAEVVAERETVVARLTQSCFRRLLHEHPALADAVMLRLASLVRWLSRKVYEYHALTVPGRLYAELLRLCARVPGTSARAVISPAPTNTDLATRIMATREQVSRTMSDLAARALVERHGPDEIAIANVAALEELLEAVERS